MCSIAITRFVPTTDLDNVIAFFDCELDFSNSLRITLYGCKLVRNKSNELFVGLPQKKGTNDKYYNHFFLSPALLLDLTTTAIAHHTRLAA
jgi:hypothetical protein